MRHIRKNTMFTNDGPIFISVESYSIKLNPSMRFPTEPFKCSQNKFTLNLPISKRSQFVLDSGPSDGAITG